MNYKQMLKIIAKTHNTTPEEVDREMRAAIKTAGYDISPEVFISLVVGKVKGEMSEKKGDSL